MKAVYKRELSTYFTGATGYIFCAFLLLFVGLYTSILCFKNSIAQFEYVLGNMAFVYLIIVPVITMRVVSEERRQKTDQLLYSLPISTTDVILGKYLALVTVLLIPTAITCIYPFIINRFGTVNFPASYAAIIGFFFMGCALLAIGLYISSVTESMVLAAGICFVVLLLNYFLATIVMYIGTAAYISFIVCGVVAMLLVLIVYLMTKNFFATVLSAIVLVGGLCLAYLSKSSLFEGLVPMVLSKLSLFDRYNNFMYGTLNLSDIVFYLSVAGIFIFLAVQSMEKRRWS